MAVLTIASVGGTKMKEFLGEVLSRAGHMGPFVTLTVA
jgi:hypothetical protein